MSRIFSQISIILLIVTTTAYSYEPLFYSRSDYQMSNYIESMTAADFNNDGYVDFACGGKTSGPVNIFLSLGDGTYMDPIPIDSDIKLTSINHGDFNGDGWIDLVTLTNNINDINIIMNQGNGTFTLQQSYAGLSSQGLTVMDMNNDGYDDILKMYGPELGLLFSNGDGTFAIGEAGEDIIAIPMDFSGSLLPFDVNHDAYEDLLVWGSKTIYTDSVNYYFQPVLATYVNNGDSTFQSGVEYLHGSSIMDLMMEIETGNFNSDSETDLLITDRQYNRILLVNNGDGSFSPVKSFVKDYPIGVACGDVNGDDYSDIIISDSENASVSVMLNNGGDEISFADAIDYSGKWGTNPTFIKKLFSTDVNNDSYDDIILYDWTLSTIFSRGDGTFPILNTVDDMGVAAFDILADDFNGDGFTDLMTLDGNRYVYIKYSDGQGGYNNRQRILVLTDPRGIFSGDFNADEIVDFCVTSTNGISIYHGLETGGFQLAPLGGAVGFIAGYDGMAADFNDDGFMDFATYYSGAYDLNIVLSDSIGEYHTDSYNLAGTLQTGIAAADIDGDNDLDIVVSGYNNSNPGGPGVINVNYNDGNGQFSNDTVLTTEFMAMGVVLEDLNDDGYPDLAATQYGTYDGYVSVYLNNQDGTFPTQVNYAQLYAPAYRDITAADMDNDGDMDLLASIEMYADIAVLMNSGDGNFPEVQFYAGGDNIKAFTIAHLDSGSTMDLAVTSSTPNRDFVYLFLNTGLDLLPPPVIDYITQETTPNDFILGQNYPNPFNPKTVIRYQLPVTSQVDLSIYNVLGQKITTLVSEKQPAGTYNISWDASGFSSGMYFYKLETPANIQVQKMLLIK